MKAWSILKRCLIPATLLVSLLLPASCTPPPPPVPTATATLGPQATALPAATVAPLSTVAPSPTPMAQSSPTPRPPAAPTPLPAAVDKVKVFLVALEDNGASGKKIGCNDSVVAVERTIAPTQAPLTAALQELLSIKDQHYGQSGLYNALYQSNLQVESVVIAGGQATVRLTGTHQLGGECDTPRFEAQLQETVLQFPGISDVAIYLNGFPMEQVLSLKGS